MCNAKVFRVKNHSSAKSVITNSGQVPVSNDEGSEGRGGQPTPQGRRKSDALKTGCYYFGVSGAMKRMPKSVSGYSLCATNEEDMPATRCPPRSVSAYSMSSGNIFTTVDTKGNDRRAFNCSVIVNELFKCGLWALE